MDEQDEVNRQVVLENAIQRAIDNGWSGHGHYDAKNLAIDALRSEENENWVELLFNHDFAKALWGGLPFKELRDEPTYKVAILNWQYQLQQMVIAKDPIEYLADNLN